LCFPRSPNARDRGHLPEAAALFMLRGKLFDGRMAFQIRLSCANQLQVIRLIGDGAMAEGARNLPVFQKEHARHLLCVFLDPANSILEKRAPEPGQKDGRMQRVQVRVGAL